MLKNRLLSSKNIPQTNILVSVVNENFNVLKLKLIIFINNKKVSDSFND